MCVCVCMMQQIQLVHIIEGNMIDCVYYYALIHTDRHELQHLQEYSHSSLAGHDIINPSAGPFVQKAYTKWHDLHTL